jgi:hypothetical protein
VSANTRGGTNGTRGDVTASPEHGIAGRENSREDAESGRVGPVWREGPVRRARRSAYAAPARGSRRRTANRAAMDAYADAESPGREGRPGPR